MIIIGDWGFIPAMLDEGDPRPARNQLDKGYRHGGGWLPFKGFAFDVDLKQLQYPGDPPMHPLGILHFRAEKLYIFESSWVVIVQPDGVWEVARMD